APAGTAPGCLGLRLVPQGADAAAFGGACGRLFRRHISVSALDQGWVMETTTTDWLVTGIEAFAFGYPFVMAWYWMVGGLMFYIARERHMPPLDRPPPM